MDSGQDCLFVAVIRKLLDFPKHTVPGAASDPSPDIRNDTVGTELVAAVLHLYVCAGMFCRLLKVQFLVFIGMVDVQYFFFKPFFAGLKSFQYLNQILLAVVPNHNIHTFLLLALLCLDVTAACHH